MANRLSKFLLSELEIRDWSQADLARKSGLSRTAISDVISGRRRPGVELCSALAIALGLPPETLFRESGLLPDLPSQRAVFEEILTHRLSTLDDTQLREVLLYIEFIQSKESSPQKQNREGVAPPEVLK